MPSHKDGRPRRRAVFSKSASADSPKYLEGAHPSSNCTLQRNTNVQELSEVDVPPKNRSGSTYRAVTAAAGDSHPSITDMVIADLSQSSGRFQNQDYNAKARKESVSSQSVYSASTRRSSCMQSIRSQESDVVLATTALVELQSLAELNQKSLGSRRNGMIGHVVPSEGQVFAPILDHRQRSSRTEGLPSTSATDTPKESTVCRVDDERYGRAHISSCYSAASTSSISPSTRTYTSQGTSSRETSPSSFASTSSSFCSISGVMNTRNSSTISFQKSGIVFPTVTRNRDHTGMLPPVPSLSMVSADPIKSRNISSSPNIMSHAAPSTIGSQCKSQAMLGERISSQRQPSLGLKDSLAERSTHLETSNTSYLPHSPPPGRSSTRPPTEAQFSALQTHQTIESSPGNRENSTRSAILRSFKLSSRPKLPHLDTSTSHACKAMISDHTTQTLPGSDRLFRIFGRHNKSISHADKATKDRKTQPPTIVGQVDHGRRAGMSLRNSNGANCSARKQSVTNTSVGSPTGSASQDSFLLQRISPVVIAGGGHIVENKNTNAMSSFPRLKGNIQTAAQQQKKRPATSGNDSKRHSLLSSPPVVSNVKRGWISSKVSGSRRAETKHQHIESVKAVDTTMPLTPRSRLWNVFRTSTNELPANDKAVEALAAPLPSDDTAILLTERLSRPAIKGADVRVTHKSEIPVPTAHSKTQIKSTRLPEAKGSKGKGTAADSRRCALGVDRRRPSTATFQAIQKDVSTCNNNEKVISVRQGADGPPSSSFSRPFSQYESPQLSPSIIANDSKPPHRRTSSPRASNSSYIRQTSKPLPAIPVRLSSAKTFTRTPSLSRAEQPKVAAELDNALDIEAIISRILIPDQCDDMFHRETDSLFSKDFHNVAVVSSSLNHGSQSGTDTAHVLPENSGNDADNSRYLGHIARQESLSPYDAQLRVTRGSSDIRALDISTRINTTSRVSEVPDAVAPGDLSPDEFCSIVDAWLSSTRRLHVSGTAEKRSCSSSKMAGPRINAELDAHEEAQTFNTRPSTSITRVDVRTSALTVSKWLTFGRVLFSPAGEAAVDAYKQSCNPSILIIDGLQTDDWSRFVAASYPSTTVHSISTRSSVPTTPIATATPHTPTNYHKIYVSSLSARFNFPRDSFSTVVIRFPPAAPSTLFRHLIIEAKRVLKPLGFLELSILDMDMSNMGPKCRKAIKALRADITAAKPDVEFSSASDTLLKEISTRGFSNVKSCKVRIPVSGPLAGMPTESPHGTNSRKGSTVTLSSTSDYAKREGGDQPQHDINNMVATVGRWWWSQCYEGDTREKIAQCRSDVFDDAATLRECEDWGTSFRLCVSYARKPAGTRCGGRVYRTSSKGKPSN